MIPNTERLTRQAKLDASDLCVDPDGASCTSLDLVVREMMRKESAHQNAKRTRDRPAIHQVRRAGAPGLSV